MSTIDRGSVNPSQAGTDTIPAEQSGWVMFAAIMFIFIGIWNIFEGFFGLFRSTWFVGTAAFGPLWAWSLVWIGVGVLLAAAGYALIAGRSWARWFGIVVASMSAFSHLLALPVYPFWSVFALTIDVLILFGLAARWQPSERMITS